MLTRLGPAVIAALAIAACSNSPQSASPAVVPAPDATTDDVRSDRRVQSHFGSVFDRFDDRNDRDRERRRRARERERERNNRNPRVSLDWEPSPYRLGEAILTASASDRDGDRLRFRWYARFGDIRSRGRQAVYTPRYYGQDEIVVQVRDNEGGFDTDSVVIEIEDLFDLERRRFSFLYY